MWSGGVQDKGSVCVTDGRGGGEQQEWIRKGNGRGLMDKKPLRLVGKKKSEKPKCRMLKGLQTKVKGTHPNL